MKDDDEIGPPEEAGDDAGLLGLAGLLELATPLGLDAGPVFDEVALFVELLHAVAVSATVATATVSARRLVVLKMVSVFKVVSLVVTRRRAGRPSAPPRTRFRARERPSSLLIRVFSTTGDRETQRVRTFASCNNGVTEPMRKPKA